MGLLHHMGIGDAAAATLGTSTIDNTTGASAVSATVVSASSSASAAAAASAASVAVSAIASSAGLPCNISLSAGAAGGADQTPYHQWLCRLQSDDVFAIAGSFVIAIIIVVTSAPPAAVIWRTASLHRASYFYVLILCVLDCLLGVTIFVMTSLVVIGATMSGGVPKLVCIISEAASGAIMNAVNAMLLFLSRDRLLSVRHALTYPLMVAPGRE